MKPTTEQILSALNEMIQSKTELKSEKIELGAIDDFDKLFKQAIGDNTAEKLIDNLRKAEVGFEKGLKDFQKALKEGDTIKVLAKDLGIDIPKEVINKIDSMAQYIKDYNKYISKVKSMYNIF
jgi:flagellar hook-associated protein FlgK